MINYSLTLQNLTKSFGRRLIFKNINAEFNSGNIYGFAGSNGSGKSTLAQIVAGIISPTSGKAIHKLNNEIITSDKLHQYLGFVSPYLYDSIKDLLKGYSSGMKQRIKFIFALIHNPQLLIFDEPTSNLDIKGKDAVYKMIEEESKEKLIILGSNEESDLSLCQETIYVENYKNSEIDKR
jgi:heme exporter protein A